MVRCSITSRTCICSSGWRSWREETAADAAYAWHGEKDVEVPPSFQKDKEDDMVTSVKQMMEAANAAVPRLTPAQAKEMMAKGNTLVVDVRDAMEVQQSGKFAGAVHVPRGL